ncbi:hypothetical protein VE02_09924 [Pseudogymnoascus sp. 03VT05]|nr:hypothetical protein VE02_09924 [Pseudogymnoascus sp. 03VT05]
MPPHNPSFKDHHPHPLSHRTNTATAPTTTAIPALPTTLLPALGIGVGIEPPPVPVAPLPVPLAPSPPPLPPVPLAPPPPAAPIEESGTAVNTAAKHGVVGASVRVTTSGPAGVEEGQVEHVTVELARAVS